MQDALQIADRRNETEIRLGCASYIRQLCREWLCKRDETVYLPNLLMCYCLERTKNRVDRVAIVSSNLFQVGRSVKVNGILWMMSSVKRKKDSSDGVYD